MGNMVKNIIFGVIVGIVGFLLIEFLFDPSNLISILAGILVGVGLSIFLIARSRGDKPEDLAKEMVQQAVQPDPGAKERLINEQLTLLNEQIRMAGLQIDVIQPCEQLIDLLLLVVPTAQEKSPGTETTFDLEQLVTTHLPKLIKTYIVLSLSDQAKQKDPLVNQLIGLHLKVSKLKEHLDAGELHAFQVEHGFLNQKY
jgi:hypothetical protein